ncbi:MAG: tRNA threonylcarbamoyladenosine dehydratase [Burkholderiales bacterium]|nr:tRNA threonylcarbamoyladenosine dehydratase [Burkholderiales bacterium]
MQQQFYRTSILLDEATLDYLAEKHIVIAGVGGVGGAVVEAIARGGVGKITLIDNDVVDITNINRQLIATLSNVGKPKVELFLSRIKSINPQCEVVVLQTFLNKDNLSALIPSDADYVIDCIDTVPSKIALISYCIHNKLNVVSSMGAGNRYDVTKIKLADISKTKMCSLARIIRLELKKQRIIKGVMVVYSEEPGRMPLVQNNGLRPINGTISYLPPLFGLMLSGYVLKHLIDNRQ